MTQERDPYILSASQIEKANSCPRKWFFQYILGVKQPTGAGAELGSAVHKVAEQYLRDGVAPDRNTEPGRIFIAGLPYLPTKGNGVVEGYFCRPIDNVEYQGYIDLRTTSDTLPAWSDEPCHIILDHKTSSNPARYGKDVTTLRRDPQAILYSRVASCTTPYGGKQDTGVGLRWLYYKTTGRAAVYPVDLWWSWEDVFNAFQSIINPIAKTLIDVRRSGERDPIKIPCNTRFCGEYGGCYYSPQCPRSNEQIITGIITKESGEMGNTLLEQLQAIQNGQSTAVQPVAVQPVQLPLPGINPPKRIRRTQAQIAADNAAAQPVAAQPVAAQPVAAQPVAAQPVQPDTAQSAYRLSLTQPDMAQFAYRLSLAQNLAILVAANTVAYPGITTEQLIALSKSQLEAVLDAVE